MNENEIITFVAETMSTTVENIMSKSKNQSAVDARDIVSKLLFDKFEYKHHEIATLLKRKERSVIAHAIKRIEDKIEFDSEISSLFHFIENNLKK